MDLTTVSSYRRAESAADLALAPGERLLGGGTWLFSEPQPAVTGLVDLTALAWPAVEELSDGGVRVAGTCTIAALQQHDWPTPGAAALVRQCADAFLMSFKIQHAATVGGNLALALPAGAMISLTSALAGEAVIWAPGGGERRELVSSLVTGVGTTTLAPGEVIRAVDLPRWALTSPTAFRRISLTEYGRSSVVVIGRSDPDVLVLTITAATPRPVVLLLPPSPSERFVRRAIAEIAGTAGWHDDAHGAPDWRAAMTAEFAVEIAAELAVAPGSSA